MLASSEKLSSPEVVGYDFNQGQLRVAGEQDVHHQGDVGGGSLICLTPLYYTYLYIYMYIYIDTYVYV